MYLITILIITEYLIFFLTQTLYCFMRGRRRGRREERGNKHWPGCGQGRTSPKTWTMLQAVARCGIPLGGEEADWWVCMWWLPTQNRRSTRLRRIVAVTASNDGRGGWRVGEAVRISARQPGEGGVRGGRRMVQGRPPVVWEEEDEKWQRDPGPWMEMWRPEKMTSKA